VTTSRWHIIHGVDSFLVFNITVKDNNVFVLSIKALCCFKTVAILFIAFDLCLGRDTKELGLFFLVPQPCEANAITGKWRQHAIFSESMVLF